MLRRAFEKLSVGLAHEYTFSKKDLLPGMEVRLLPHQMIGVSWYETDYLDWREGNLPLAGCSSKNARQGRKEASLREYNYLHDQIVMLIKFLGMTWASVCVEGSLMHI